MCKHDVNALKFESIVCKILNRNYKINHIARSAYDSYDIVTVNGICFEIKYTSNNSFLDISYSIKKFLGKEQYNNNIIFVTNLCGVNKKIDNVNFITLENLLYLCNNDNRLISELIRCVEFSTENALMMPLDDNIINLLKNDIINVNNLKHTNVEGDKLLTDELINIKEGVDGFRKYEKFCKKFLGKIFENSIGDIIEQYRNNNDNYRFDLISTIKNEPKSFWRFIYEKFNSLFILFECKNYADSIGQEQIFLTERYLFNNALRNVAIILTRHKPKNSAIKAVKDILKEHGKLILILDDNDLIDMENIFLENCKDPNMPNASEFLMNKTREFLLSLDK